MKKFFSWLLMGLFALTFASCSSDDDFNVEETTAGGFTVGINQAVGKWKRVAKVETKVIDGVIKDTETETEPDQFIINSDSSWEYYDYDNGELEFEVSGMLVMENGVIKGLTRGNRTVTFTSAYIANNIFTIQYNEPDYDDGKTYTKYTKITFTKIQ